MADLLAIKDRIRKLLNLANDDGAIGGEIRNAVAFAQKLMDEHHLSEDDLGSVDEKILDLERAAMARGRVNGSSKFTRWEMELSSIAGRIVGVRNYRDNAKEIERGLHGTAVLAANGNPKRCVGFIYYGTAEDVELAKGIYNELRMTIIAMARMKFGSVYRGMGRQYSEGFVVGIREAYRKSRDAANLLAASQERIGINVNALVLVEKRGDLVRQKQKHADGWLRLQGVRLRKSNWSSGASLGDGQAYGEGKRDGRATNVDASRKVKLSG